MFNLTPAAARQIQQAAFDSGAERLVLRIAAKVETDGDAVAMERIFGSLKYVECAADGAVYVHGAQAFSVARISGDTVVTGKTGEYYFRTVKPVQYPGRTPHIHYAISQNGKRLLTTQLYVRGEKGNDRDGVLRGIRDEKQRESVLVEFKPLEGSKLGELTADFPIVLGMTPEDA